jgi:hypothetical protein
MSYRTILEENYRPDVRPHLPRGRGFTHGRVFTVRRRGKNRIRVDTTARTRPCVRISFPSPLPPLPSPPPSPSLSSPLSLPPLCCPRGRWATLQFIIYNFRFSIPKIPEIPELPELRGLRGQSREKKKVFLA